MPVGASMSSQGGPSGPSVENSAHPASSGDSPPTMHSPQAGVHVPVPVPVVDGVAFLPSTAAGVGAGAGAAPVLPLFAAQYWRAAGGTAGAADAAAAAAAGNTNRRQNSTAAQTSASPAAAPPPPLALRKDDAKTTAHQSKMRRLGGGGQTQAATHQPLGMARHGVLPEALDLSRLRDRADSGPSELQLRREKFALFEKQCTLVCEEEGVYIGSDAVARNWDTLSQHGITHVVNAAAFVCEEYFKGKLAYKTLWLQDSPGEDIASVLYPCFDFIESARASRGRVLVHCSQGVSRSSAIVIAYTMWRRGWGYDAAFQYVKERRGVANPNVGFACQLLAWCKRLGLDGASDPSPAPRLLRMCRHSEHGSPPHLVGKVVPTASEELTPPPPLPYAGRRALDARACFVLQSDSRAYVWCGPEADDAHTEAAWCLARQLTTYESVHDLPIAVSQDASEPPEFLDALDAVAAPGDRQESWSARHTRVAAYDADYASSSSIVVS